ncbi:MAG TPA: 5'-3' exonuclease H3TH domain-containing protein [Microthrixaceae bacterium]|nr:5'-3' exonuclease H3TH domain-containing protein [Microthrixaceae bacterium]
MKVHLVDGTYELFRYFYSPGGGHTNAAEEQVGAVRGVLRSVLSMLDDGATHMGVATDHVIRSFRNDLWPDYKTGDGIDPLLLTQFPWLEDALRALGVTVWPMVDTEADDALGSAAMTAAADERVEQAIICTPDKDLAQCVGGKIVQFDRRAGQFRDTAAIIEKYGVEPRSIPDWLALVGDSADGFPGIAGWGAKTTAAVLASYTHLENIPHAPGQWDVPGVRGVVRLAGNLSEGYENAKLFKVLATLITDLDLGTVDDWEWKGPASDLDEWCDRLDAPDVLRKANRLATERQS